MQKYFDPSCLYYAVPQVPHPLTPTLVTAPSSTSLFQPPLQPFLVKDRMSLTEMFPNVAHPGNVGLKIDVAEDKDQKNSSYLVCETMLSAIVVCRFCFCVYGYMCLHVLVWSCAPVYAHTCMYTRTNFSVSPQYSSLCSLCSGWAASSMFK